jgi:hypothetical protein
VVICDRGCITVLVYGDFLLWLTPLAEGSQFLGAENSPSSFPVCCLNIAQGSRRGRGSMVCLRVDRCTCHLCAHAIKNHGGHRLMQIRKEYSSIQKICTFHWSTLFHSYFRDEAIFWGQEYIVSNGGVIE